MPTDVEYSPEPTATSRVKDILGDLQHLATLQFQLTRREIEEEIRQRSKAAAVMALGIGILLIGAAMLCLSGVHWLHWMTSPRGTDAAWLSLWACHAAVAATLGMIGGILAIVGRSQFRSVKPRPDSTIETT